MTAADIGPNERVILNLLDVAVGAEGVDGMRWDTLGELQL
jgi:hypothetical protein